MRKIFYFSSIFVLLLQLQTAHATTIFSWQYGSDTSTDFFRICRGLLSLTCEVGWEIPVADRTFPTPFDPMDGFIYTSLMAVNADPAPEDPVDSDGEVKGRCPYEILLKYCNGVSCAAEVTAFAGTDYIQVDAETPVMGGLFDILYFKDDDMTGELLSNVTFPLLISDLLPGTYSLLTVPKSAEGVIIGGESYDDPNLEKNNPYPVAQVTVFGSNKPNIPVIALSSKGYGDYTNPSDIQTLVGAAEMNDETVDYYKWNVYSSSTARDLAMTSLEPGDLYADVQVPYGSAFCLSVSAINYPAVFVRVTAVGTNGEESDSVAGYRLFNDIVTGPQSEAILDTADQTIMLAQTKLYSRTAYPLRFADICTAPNPYQLLMTSTDAEKCDYRGNGKVESAEYLYLRNNLGRSTEGL